MHVISKKPFNDAAKKYPNDALALMDTFKVFEKNSFKTPEELKAAFPSLDNFKYKDKWYVIDIGGNNLRLMAAIQFVHQRMYIQHIVNHADYDKLTDKYRRG
jgi:mRNA interferase HigB